MMHARNLRLLFLILALPAVLWSVVLKAQTPRVVADIAPIHSLVAQVMDGVAQPQLLISQNASPHHYSMRPSEAKALQEAHLVIYVGSGLTPWLEPLFSTTAASAQKLDLTSVDDVVLFSYREGPIFRKHDEYQSVQPVDSDTHDHEVDDHGHEDEHEHDEHDEDGHQIGHDHDDEHGEDEHQIGHDHDHHGVDPHVWLDPYNAQLWLDAIASELAQLDPRNASRYTANAQTGKDLIAQAMRRIEEYLAPVHGQSFLVYHDAFQYFEERFHIAATGSITLGDAVSPSPKRLRELKQLFEEKAINCVLSEPQFQSDLVDNVFSGHTFRIGVIDPIGANLRLSPAFYTELLENIALGIAQCVKP